MKQESHLPVFVDPSQATGNRAYIAAAALGAVAAGCDGIAIDVHPDPENAMVHGVQSLCPKDFITLLEQMLSIRQIMLTTGNQ